MIETARLTPGPGFKLINSILYYGMRLLPYAWSRRAIAFGVAKCIDWLHRSQGLILIRPPKNRVILF